MILWVESVELVYIKLLLCIMNSLRNSGNFYLSLPINLHIL